jgi:hypothetical protein
MCLLLSIWLTLSTGTPVVVNSPCPAMTQLTSQIVAAIAPVK